MEYDADQVRPTQAEPCVITGEPHEWRTKPGELLAPDRYPLERIERLRIDLGPYAFASQFDQRPTPRAGMVLNPAWFIDRPADLQLGACDIVQAWDLNYSESDDSDWTVAVTVAVERAGQLPRIHVLDVYAEHMDEQRHDVALAEYIDIWRPTLVGIEKRVNSQGATRDLVRRIMGLIEHQSCNIEPVEADADKVTRAQIISGRAKAGLISVDRNAAWWHALSSEMSRFPRSAHDDRVDALAYVVRLAVERLAKVRAMRLLLHQPVTVRQRGEVTGGWHPRVSPERPDVAG
jgi:predicted phage terminase large subunit-like protein